MKKHHLFVAALLTCAVVPHLAQAQVVRPAAPTAADMTDEQLKDLGQGIAFPYEKLDAVLRDVVANTGEVSYLKAQKRNDLDTFVRAVAIADLTKFPNWTIPADPKDPKSKPGIDQTPQLTFFINAYNGLFLKTVADAYPVQSPYDIKGLDSAKTHVVAGQTYSFAELRKKIALMDPRALFALPDGTNSGPRASSAVFRYSALDELLNIAIRSYVNDNTKVTVPNRLANTVTVNPWLQGVDEYFSKISRNKWNGIKALLVSYTTRDADQRYFSSGDYQVLFMQPDKSINEHISR